MERTDLEKCLASLRSKVIKGAKPTRPRRMRGYLKTLHGGVVTSGQSQTALNPVPKVVRTKEDQPVGEAEESNMDLNDAIGRFRGVSEEARKPEKSRKQRSKENKLKFAGLSQKAKADTKGNAPFHPDVTESMVEGEGGSAKALLKKYFSNEDNNAHTANYLLLAKAYGTPAQVKKVQAILKRNKAQGSTSKADNDWMYKNINPYYKRLTSDAKGQSEDVDFDRPCVKSIFTEQAEMNSANDERDISFAKAMLLDRVGLHRSMRDQLAEDEGQLSEGAALSPALARWTVKKLLDTLPVSAGVKREFTLRAKVTSGKMASTRVEDVWSRLSDAAQKAIMGHYDRLPEDVGFANDLTGEVQTEGKGKSAWSYIKPKYRSKNVGWTKSGEFACPYCGVSIGKNLRGDSPHGNASAHLKKEHGKTPADMAKLTEANVSILRGSSKSDFRGAYPGPQIPPEDRDAMAPMSRSAGVRGPGYGDHGREMVDVRTETVGGGGDVTMTMTTGAFIIEDEDDPPKARRRGKKRRRNTAPVVEDSSDPNFDPTRLKYPKELIGR